MMKPMFASQLVDNIYSSSMRDATTSQQNVSETNESSDMKIMEQCLHKIQRHHIAFKQDLIEGKLMEGIHELVIILQELKTQLLQPKSYISLHAQTSSILLDLIQYLNEGFIQGEQETIKGLTLECLFEAVQYIGQIMPRNYLLIGVTIIWVQKHVIEDKMEKASEILLDTLEFLKGIQHPVHGIFIRYFYISLAKEYFSKFELETVVEFLMRNFTEMNKLWVRLAFLGPLKEHPIRQVERDDIKAYIGEIIEISSNLPHMSIEVYQNTILPGLLKEILSCKDPLAQDYLTNLIFIHFPFYFQFSMLAEILKAVNEFQLIGHIRHFYSLLMEKASTDFPLEHDKLEKKTIFDIFYDQLNLLFQTRSDLELRDFLDLLFSLTKFSLKVDVYNMNNVVQILNCIYDKLKFNTFSSIYELNLLLFYLVDKASSTIDLMKLELWHSIIDHLLDDNERKLLAAKTLDRLVHLKEEKGFELCITELDVVKKVMHCLNPFISPTNEESPKERDSKGSLSPFHSIRSSTSSCELLLNGRSFEVKELEELAIEQLKFVSILGIFKLGSISKTTDLEGELEILGELESLLHKGGPLKIRFTYPILFEMIIDTMNSFLNNCRNDINVEENTQATIRKCVYFGEGLLRTLLAKNQELNKNVEFLQAVLPKSLSISNLWSPSQDLQNETCHLNYFLPFYIIHLLITDYLTLFKACDQIGFGGLASGYLTTVFGLFEEYLWNTHSQIKVLFEIIRVMRSMALNDNAIENENTTTLQFQEYEMFTEKLLDYIRKVLKKDKAASLCIQLTCLYYPLGFINTRSANEIKNEELQKRKQKAKLIRHITWTFEFIQGINEPSLSNRLLSSSIKFVKVDLLIELALTIKYYTKEFSECRSLLEQVILPNLEDKLAILKESLSDGSFFNDLRAGWSKELEEQASNKLETCWNALKELKNEDIAFDPQLDWTRESNFNIKSDILNQAQPFHLQNNSLESNHLWL